MRIRVEVAGELDVGRARDESVGRVAWRRPFWLSLGRAAKLGRAASGVRVCVWIAKLWLAAAGVALGGDTEAETADLT